MIVERKSLRVECSPEYERMAADVLDVFERLGPRPGLRIRFGWSLLRLAEEGGALRVQEPDFAAFASGLEERWVPTLDVTLEVLAAQTGLLHRLDVEGEDVYFDQKLIAAPGALEQPGIFLRRDGSRSEEDSGWSLGTLEDPEALTREEGLEAVTIASLAGRRRALLQALTLPAGFIAVFAGDAIEQIFDAAGREREPINQQ